VSLRGSLETFALTDVLTLVASTGKTGELQVVGDEMSGRVWLDGGKIVAARVDDATEPADAVFRLLRLPNGDFTFEADGAPPDPGDPEEVSTVLAAAQERLAEWRDIQSVVPSVHAWVTLDGTGDGDVQLSSQQWALVVQVGDGRSVQDLMGRLGRDELVVGRLAKGLVEAGLATVAAAPAPAPAPGPAPAPAPAAEVAPSAPPPGTPTATTRSGAAKADLVRQLASLNEATYAPKDRDAHEAAPEDVDEESTESTGEAPHGTPVGGDDTVNRGMLLKFLSSVRS